MIYFHFIYFSNLVLEENRMATEQEKANEAYGVWRTHLQTQLPILDKEIETEFDGEAFVRLPDQELDWKFETWARLQKILASGWPVENNIAEYQNRVPSSEWPDWVQKTYSVIRTKDSRRTCRQVIAQILEVIKA
jgi:hypothetical protein